MYLIVFIKICHLLNNKKKVKKKIYIYKLVAVTSVFSKINKKLFKRFLVYYELNTYLDQSFNVWVVFVNLRIAFDAVNLNVLLQFMGEVRGCGLVNKLLYFDLTNRNFRERIQEKLSTPHIGMDGVLQGSLLTILIYIIYIKDTWSAKL